MAPPVPVKSHFVRKMDFTYITTGGSSNVAVTSFIKLAVNDVTVPVQAFSFNLLT